MIGPGSDKKRSTKCSESTEWCRVTVGISNLICGLLTIDNSAISIFLDILVELTNIRQQYLTITTLILGRGRHLIIRLSCKATDFNLLTFVRVLSVHIQQGKYTQNLLKLADPVHHIEIFLWLCAIGAKGAWDNKCNTMKWYWVQYASLQCLSLWVFRSSASMTWQCKCCASVVRVLCHSSASAVQVHSGSNERIMCPD